MIVYVVEESEEVDWYNWSEEIIGVYENEEKAITKKQELMELRENRFKKYYVTTYDTETGEEIKNLEKLYLIKKTGL